MTIDHPWPDCATARSFFTRAPLASDRPVPGRAWPGGMGEVVPLLRVLPGGDRESGWSAEPVAGVAPFGLDEAPSRPLPPAA